MGGGGEGRLLFVWRMVTCEWRLNSRYSIYLVLSTLLFSAF